MPLPSLAVFRHRAFTRFWLGRVMAVLAMEMQTTAIGWQVYDAARADGKSVAEAALILGFMGLAQFGPLLLLSLVGGRAADRYDRKSILLLCYLAKAAIAIGLALSAGLTGDALIMVILAASLGAGALRAFMPAANTALLPTLVPREDLPRAVAWGALGFQGGIVVGPALGGLLYALGPVTPYASAAALFLVSLGLLTITETPKRDVLPPAQGASMIFEGLKFVWSNKLVLGAISLDLVVGFFAGAIALLPVFARDILYAGPAELGILRSAMGAGACVVALVIAVAPIRRNVGRWMFASTVVFGLATLAFGVSQSLWLSVGALAIAGGADIVSVFIRQTLIQMATPDAMRGRVGAVSMLCISASNELGDFEAGLVARFVGPMAAVVFGAGAAIAASAAWWRLFPSLARADDFDTRIGDDREQ
ncbi:MAG TPA: MFS transporter [Terricaulis sp.]|nr:MFS transporter [Terricaulis sp.]